MKWFKNLQKWQKGGLIGCAVGLLFVIIILLSPYSLQRLIESFNVMCYLPAVILAFLTGNDEGSTGYAIVEYGGLIGIVIFYGVLGILIGRAQQMVNVYWKWLLTALLALLLLGFYVIGYATY